MNSNLRVSRNFIFFIFLVFVSIVFGFYKTNSFETNSSEFYHNLIKNNKVLIKEIDLNLDSIKDVIVISENKKDRLEFRTIYMFLVDNSKNYTLIDSNSKMIFKEFGATRNQLEDIDIENNGNYLKITQCVGWSYNWHTYLTLSFELNTKCDFNLIDVSSFETKLENEEDDNSEWIEITEHLTKNKIHGINFHNLNSELIIEQISNK